MLTWTNMNMINTNELQNKTETIKKKKKRGKNQDENELKDHHQKNSEGLKKERMDEENKKRKKKKYSRTGMVTKRLCKVRLAALDCNNEQEIEKKKTRQPHTLAEM